MKTTLTERMLLRKLCALLLRARRGVDESMVGEITTLLEHARSLKQRLRIGPDKVPLFSTRKAIVDAFFHHATELSISVNSFNLVTWLLQVGIINADAFALVALKKPVSEEVRLRSIMHTSTMERAYGKWREFTQAKWDLRKAKRRIKELEHGS